MANEFISSFITPFASFFCQEQLWERRERHFPPSVSWRSGDSCGQFIYECFNLYLITFIGVLVVSVVITYSVSCLQLLIICVQLILLAHVSFRRLCTACFVLFSIWAGQCAFLMAMIHSLLFETQGFTTSYCRDDMWLGDVPIVTMLARCWTPVE